ncbi:MAG: rod shape-determining protein RodA [Candidatus Theseobacter exili]|nr:rod shape-determining protein RodA [Candidatus Theseobacter exili]
MSRYENLKKVNYTLILCVFLLLGIGLIFIYSATYQREHFMGVIYRQLLWVLIGIIAFSIMLKINLKFLDSIAYFIYAANLFLLLAVLFAGRVHLGAQRWLHFGGFALQPSEFAKVSIILVLARYLSDNIDFRDKISYILKPFILVTIPMVMIIKQPDLGTSMIFLPVLFAMLFVAGARIKLLMGIVALGASALPVFWMFLQNYQKMRLKVFINPNIDPLGAGYTAIQSKIAVGSGGYFGKGWLMGTQNQLSFLPERHTDFIFSVLGEEWGFIGCLGVLLLFLIILVMGLMIADNSGSLFGKLTAVGLTVMITSHVLINVGMTIGIMPITGLPLPFLSYGGSSLLTMMCSIGLLENISMRKSVFY